MRVFRKLKTFTGVDKQPYVEPVPDVVHQVAAEQAARFVLLKERERRAYAEMHPDEPLPPMPDRLEIPMPSHKGHKSTTPYIYAEDTRSSSPFEASRSRGRERSTRNSPLHFNRAGSPDHFRHGPPGTPQKYRRRPHSPYAVRSRPSSPYFLDAVERPPSPYHFAASGRSSPQHFGRRHRHMYASEEMEDFDRQQQYEQEMLFNNAGPYMPPYNPMQQPFYPMNPMGHYNQYPMSHPQMYTPYYL